MLSTKMQEVADHFNLNWQDYKSYVQRNQLCHKEMYAALSKFLQEQKGKQDFSFVDMGCGDCSGIASVLLPYSVKKYIGVDIANAVLSMAPANTAELTCKKKFILANMANAIKQIPPVDIIFSSYAIHHLTYQEKFDFIFDCKNVLNPGGFLLMIDGVKERNQTRYEWLNAYEAYLKRIFPNITQADLTLQMQHPRSSDYPESISTFEFFSYQLGWASFQVLAQIGSTVFILFGKGTE